MKLTGKCKEDFFEWLLNTRNEEMADGEIVYDLYYLTKYMLPESLQNSLIIEFFDSVGIKIIITPTMFIDKWHCDIFGWSNCEILNLPSRPEAINEAIIKANDLHNQK